MKKFQILIFGASSTHGNGDELGGWAHRIRLHVIKKTMDDPDKYHGNVFNLGVPGDSAEDVLNRIEPEIKARLFYPETIILLSVGTNDSRIKYDNKKAFFTDKAFEENQDKLIKIVKKYTNKILFVGLTPVDEKITDPWYDCSYLNERIEKFNNIIKSVCREHNVEYLDLYNQFILKDYLKNIYDGLHPNSSGHKKIFDLVQPFVDKFLK